MKWKDVGLALVAFVLPAWCLMAADRSNAVGPPAALPSAERQDQRVERDAFFWQPAPTSADPIALVSCLDPSAEAADGSPNTLPDPSSGPAGRTPRESLEEVEPGFRFPSGFDASVGDAPFGTLMAPPYREVFAARLGGWLVDAHGSPTKVAEYQGLKSSPFLDLDGLFSDGLRTVNLSGTYLDNDTSQAGLDYFGPRLWADFDLQRYLHRLDHDPLNNMGDVRSLEEIVKEDLNAGEDYAIRVEDIKASFGGRLSENIKVRLNFRSLHRHGTRQVNATQHCFEAEPRLGETPHQECHVLTRRQEIDWRTEKLEPVIEAKFGPVRAEYSRPMRFFNQNDQVVLQDFGLHFPDIGPYAFVPNNVTQTDRLKLGVDLGAQTDLYARLSVGDTENLFRDTHRNFQVCDVRLTNRTWEALSLTGYITINKQQNQLPPFLLPAEQAALSVPNAGVPPYGIRHPVDYSLATVGAEASWQPFQWSSLAKGFSLTAGCEEGALERKFADYFIEDPQIVVDQRHTVLTSVHVGASMRFSPALETHARYRYKSVQDPLFGVNRYEGTTNTSLPEDEHLAEVGGMWRPLANLMANVTVGVQDRTNHSQVADFDETSFPMTLTLWYGLTPAWSFSAGYGYYSSWTRQDILFPSDDPQAEIWTRKNWNFGNRYRVLSLGTAYAWTPKISLSGGLQLVNTRAALDPLEPWPDLAEDTQVLVDRTRVTAGVDWKLREQVSAYFRYSFDQYLDGSAAYNDGSAHMTLVGLSGVY